MIIYYHRIITCSLLTIPCKFMYYILGRVCVIDMVSALRLRCPGFDPLSGRVLEFFQKRQVRVLFGKWSLENLYNL